MKYAEGLDIGYGKFGSALATIGMMVFGGLFFGLKCVSKEFPDMYNVSNSLPQLRNIILRYLPKQGEGAPLE